MKSQIYFKIKNEKNYDSIRFTGGSLSLKDLKTKIKEKLQDKNAGIGKEKDKDKAKDDILVIDELTKQLISDDTTAIASDRKVLIERSSALPLLGATGYRSYATGIKADKSEFMCPLCKNQFVNPTLTRCCGGTACETCIDKSVKQKNECPFCHKKALGSIKAGPNKPLQDLIHKQPTSMPPAVPMAHGYGSQPMNPNVAMNSVPFKEVEKYLNGAKYFIIKSSNFENIQLSIKHSEWATTKANETKLNNAFQRSKNVILIFSVNKSSQFQGYARMESLSTNRAASWQVQDSIKLGGSFKILWLRVCNVNFSRVSQMKNKFNNGEPIKKSRDTQEIPEDIGFQICNMFELPDKDNTTMHYPTSSDRPKFMYQYGGIPSSMGYPGPEYTAASSPRDMREFKPLSSDTASPNDGKSPMSKLASDDFQSNIEREDYYEEEKKKDEPEIDLLADLDFDEPTNFEPAPEPKIQTEQPAPVQTEKPVESHIMEGIDLDDFPLEHEVANLDEIVEELDAEVAPEIEIEPEAEAAPEAQVEDNIARSEAKESIQQEQEHDEDQDDFLHNLESFEESDKIQEEEPDYEQRHKQQEEEERPQPPPPKMHYEDEKRSSSPKSPSPEKQAEEKKKPKPPTVDMHKFPPAPNMPYDASSMMAQGGSYMPRPPPVMDHRPPPPNMYPSAPQSMRYQQQYGSYPNQYQNTPYGNYPMAPYPGMDQRMQMGGMNPNYPYQYYGYPGMWGGQNTGRPFQMDSRGRPEGAENDGDHHSEGSEESDGSRKREKKKHKKEKKKKRSRERSKDRSREREKSNVREKGRSRDRSREKSRNKSKSKSRRK